MEPLEINQNAHRQMSTYLGIASKYYDKMLAQSPELWGEIVQELVEQHRDEFSAEEIKEAVRCVADRQLEEST